MAKLPKRLQKAAVYRAWPVKLCPRPEDAIERTFQVALALEWVGTIGEGVATLSPDGRNWTVRIPVQVARSEP